LLQFAELPGVGVSALQQRRHAVVISIYTNRSLNQELLSRDGALRSRLIQSIQLHSNLCRPVISKSSIAPDRGIDLGYINVHPKMAGMVPFDMLPYAPFLLVCVSAALLISISATHFHPFG
jgi:hypothetical protein